MQGIFRKENTDKALKYGIYRHLPTYEKIIRNLVSFYTSIKKWIQDFDYDELYNGVYNEEKLSELYFVETNDYLKIQLFRALFEVNPGKEIKEEDVLVKFINESYHIENDYAYYLDMVKFETVPEYIVRAIDNYMEKTYSKV